jgi:hypothetical protein
VAEKGVSWKKVLIFAQMVHYGWQTRGFNAHVKVIAPEGTSNH